MMELHISLPIRLVAALCEMITDMAAQGATVPNDEPFKELAQRLEAFEQHLDREQAKLLPTDPVM